MPNEDTGARRDHEQHEGSDQTYREREYLHSQYVEHRKSAKEIADDCGVSSSTIHRWLDRHDIERTPRYKDESWLRTQYVERRKDQQTIADECDVAETTICHWLARLGITDGESFKTGECTPVVIRSDTIRRSETVNTARTSVRKIHRNDRSRSHVQTVSGPFSAGSLLIRNSARWLVGEPTIGQTLLIIIRLAGTNSGRKLSNGMNTNALSVE